MLGEKIVHVTPISLVAAQRQAVEENPVRTKAGVLFSQEKSVAKSLLRDDRVNLITDRGWQNVKTIPESA